MFGVSGFSVSCLYTSMGYTFSTSPVGCGNLSITNPRKRDTEEMFKHPPHEDDEGVLADPTESGVWLVRLPYPTGDIEKVYPIWYKEGVLSPLTIRWAEMASRRTILVKTKRRLSSHPRGASVVCPRLSSTVWTPPPRTLTMRVRP